MIVTCVITLYVMVGTQIHGVHQSVRGVFIKQSTDSSRWLVNFQTDLKKNNYDLSLNNTTQWVNQNECLKGEF